jgi:hypothetical protein
MLCAVCGLGESPACDAHGWPPGFVAPRRSEAATLRALIEHYEAVAQRAQGAVDEEGGELRAATARAARREAASLRRELRTVRLLGWDDPQHER